MIMEGLRKVFILAFIMIIFMVSHAYGEEEFFKKGDIIEFGNYNNEPILWQVVHIDENGNPLLFSKEYWPLKLLMQVEINMNMMDTMVLVGITEALTGRYLQLDNG